MLHLRMAEPAPSQRSRALRILLIRSLLPSSGTGWRRAKGGGCSGKCRLPSPPTTQALCSPNAEASEEQPSFTSQDLQDSEGKKMNKCSVDELLSI